MAQNLTTAARDDSTQFWKANVTFLILSDSRKVYETKIYLQTNNNKIETKYKSLLRRGVELLLHVLHDFPAFWLVDVFQKNSSYHQVLNTKNKKKSPALRVTRNFPPYCRSWLQSAAETNVYCRTLTADAEQRYK